ncbi:MAG: hypothetical protein ACK40L_19630, partial [Hydrogenophaga sp.]
MDLLRSTPPAKRSDANNLSATQSQQPDKVAQIPDARIGPRKMRSAIALLACRAEAHTAFPLRCAC